MMLRARPGSRGSPRRCRAACRRPTCDRLRRRRVERQPLSAWSKTCASGDPGAAVGRAERQSRHDRVRECAEPVLIPVTRALRPYGCAPALPHGGAPSVMRTAASRTEPRCPNLSDGIVGAGGPVQRTSSSPRRDVRCSAGYHTRALDMDELRALPAQHRPDPEPTARMLPARCARWMKSLGRVRDASAGSRQRCRTGSTARPSIRARHGEIRVTAPSPLRGHRASPEGGGPVDRTFRR